MTDELELARSTDKLAASKLVAFEGNIDRLSADRILGWAWVPDRPNEPVELEILLDDIPAGALVADLFREGLLAEGIGDGRHAFEWSPAGATALPDGQYEVKLRLGGTDAVLEGDWVLYLNRFEMAPKRKERNRFRGFLDQVEPYRVAGWVWNPERPSERLSVDVLLNGTVMATVSANAFRQDLKDAGIGDGAYSFAWVPDISILIPGTYKVEMRIAGTQDEFCEPQVMRYVPSVLIDGVASLDSKDFVKGWAWNKLRPDDTVTVGLFEGENLLVMAPADQFDPTLSARGMGCGTHAFQLRLPSFFDRQPRVFSIRALPSGLELAGSPITVSPAEDRRVSLHQKYRTLDANAELATLSEGVWNLANITPASDIADPERYLKSCLSALDSLSRGGDMKAAQKSLHFPKFEDPEISIIIPAHNQYAYTWRCLNSVAVATWGLRFEVILVDDCSDDDTLTISDWADGLRYIRQDENKHFILSCNHGATEARGKYLYFLNNDTELTPNAIRALLQTFVDFPSTGVVGSKLIYPNGDLQEVGCLLYDTGEAHNVGRHERDQTLPEFSYLRECHYVSGASLMIPRDLFFEVGEFDERFVPAYFEDSDLCLSVSAIGRQVFVQPTSVVIHYERASAPDDSAKAAFKLMKQNYPKFLSKWGSRLVKHLRVGDPLGKFKDVGVTRRCLFFDWRTPRVDEDAGSYAAMQEMRQLRELGVKVTFASIQLEYAGRHTEALQRLGIECVYKPHYQSWQELVEKRGNEFDFIYGMRFENMEQVVDQMKSLMPHAKIIFNCADLHFLRGVRQAQFKSALGDPTAAEAFASAEVVKGRELSVMRKSDCVIVYNELERELVQAELFSKPVVVMPWVVPTRERVPGWEDRDGIMFLGSHQHLPNRDAVKFFARQVMPLVRTRVPDCMFFVYGSEMESMQSSLDDAEGVKVVGYVRNLEIAFDAHRIFVAPLQYGAGIKGKLVMALCNGIPSVVTQVASEGMIIRGGLEVAFAQTAPEFADQVVELYQSERKWNAMSGSALRFARQSFMPEGARTAIREAILATGLGI